MDGQECSEITYAQVLKNDIRLDSEYYSKRNLLLQKKLTEIGTKTIGEYGAKTDCSAFYPSITGHYSNDRSKIPFLRVNEIVDGLVSITEDTVFLPEDILTLNAKTIALAYPGDIIIAKGGNTLAKVGLVTDEYPVYATCRDVIILRTQDLKELDKHYLWAFLHSSYGQGILWRSASQTGQPHLTLPSISKIKVPDAKNLQKSVAKLYKQSVELKLQAERMYREAETLLDNALDISSVLMETKSVAVKRISESFFVTGRLDAEYYQPKFDALKKCLSKFHTEKLGGKKGLVEMMKSVEPGSDAYQDKGIPFIRVRDINKFGISKTEIYLSDDAVNNPEKLYPKRDTILFSKDGSVGIAYKMEADAKIITSGALLHLKVREVSTILPSYLTMVLNSPIVQLQAERDANGAIIQHWKPSEIAEVIIPVISMQEQNIIAKLVDESFVLRRRSAELLNFARNAIEIAIERDEVSALKWLDENNTLL